MSVTSITIGLTFLFVFLANVSTQQSKRKGYMLACVCVFGVYIFRVAFRGGSVLFTPTESQYYFSLGLILPQLLARFYVQYQIKSPLEFVSQNLHVYRVVVVVAFEAFMIYYISAAIHPSIVNYKTGEGIYTNADVQYKFSFVIALIIIGLTFLYMYMPWQRSAFCANGLLDQGLLWDWSHFKSYEWENEEMYLDPDASELLDQNTLIGLMLHPKAKLTFPHVRLHYTVPYSNKEAIDKILKQALSS